MTIARRLKPEIRTIHDISLPQTQTWVENLAFFVIFMTFKESLKNGSFTWDRENDHVDSFRGELVQHDLSQF